jgi:streptomycin 6-kinase
MSRVFPGSDLSVADDGEAVELVAPLIRSLHSSKLPAANPFSSLEDAISIHLRHRGAQAEREAPELVRLVDLAASAARELAESSNEQVLLHGDLMDKNLLMGGHGQVVAIDPMPRVGDPHADIGFWACARQPAAAINQRVERLSILLGRDPDRATRWATVWAVSAACESWRADTPELRRWAQGNQRTLTS